jgi:hypothetical protein
MDKAFSIEEALRFGWQKTKENSLVLFQVMLSLFALNVVSGIISSELKNTATGGILSLLIGVAGIILGTGFVVITLKIAKGEASAYRDIVPPMALVWWVFIASLLLGILVFAGLILLVIPGIYFALRFSMVRFSVIEGSGIMEAFEKSTKMTDGHKWQLLGFFAVLVVLNIIGAILLGVGLLVTIPVTMIGVAHVYLKLKERAGITAAPSLAHTHEGHEHHDHSGHEHTHEGHDHSHEENQ